MIIARCSISKVLFIEVTSVLQLHPVRKYLPQVRYFRITESNVNIRFVMSIAISRLSAWIWTEVFAKSQIFAWNERIQMPRRMNGDNQWRESSDAIN